MAYHKLCQKFLVLNSNSRLHYPFHLYINCEVGLETFITAYKQIIKKYITSFNVFCKIINKEIQKLT